MLLNNMHETTPEQELFIAFLKQAVDDYVYLDPTSDKKTSDLPGTEGEVFASAKAFLFDGAEALDPLDLSLDELLYILDINKPKFLRKLEVLRKETGRDVDKWTGERMEMCYSPLET